jgi:hypothetical protein
VEPINHWRPVTAEYQTEFLPATEALPVRRKKRTRVAVAQVGVDTTQDAFIEEGEPTFAVTCIRWLHFVRACVYFVLGSALLSYPTSQLSAWLMAHAHILTPFKITATETAPFINLFAETFFVLSIVSAIIGVMWLMRRPLIRWITMLYAAASLTRTVLFFVAVKGVAPSILLSAHQAEGLAAGAVVNLLVFSYLIFFSGLKQETPENPMDAPRPVAITDRVS